MEHKRLCWEARECALRRKLVATRPPWHQRPRATPPVAAKCSSIDRANAVRAASSNWASSIPSSRRVVRTDSAVAWLRKVRRGAEASEGTDSQAGDQPVSRRQRSGEQVGCGGGGRGDFQFRSCAVGGVMRGEESPLCSAARNEARLDLNHLRGVI